MKCVLSIAGSDCSGGAGIQADIKTITANRLYAMSVITSLTAQNTTGVYGIRDTEPEFVAQQMDCVFRDIRPDALKTGMLSNAGIIETVAAKLTEYKAENLVADPVMVSTSGCALLAPEAMTTLIGKLLPLARLVTPNIPESEKLCGFAIDSEEKMRAAGKAIFDTCGAAVLVKGGHFGEEAADILFDGKDFHRFSAVRLSTKNTHGTGCTLSSVIACGLAKGETLAEAVRHGKEYVFGALKADLRLGHGNGPLKHTWNIEEHTRGDLKKV